MAAGDRQARAAIALGAMAWVYLRAMYRNDFVRATGILTAFQQEYNRNRDTLLLNYPPAARADMDNRLPRSLATNGVYDSNTYIGVAASLGTLGQPVIGIAASLPSSDFQLGGWYGNRLHPIQSSLNPGALQAVEGAIASSTSGGPLDAGLELSAWYFGYTEGLEDLGVSTVAGGAVPAGNMEASGVMQIPGLTFPDAAFGGGSTQALPGAGAPPPAEQDAVVDLSAAAASVVALPGGLLVTAGARRWWSDWRLWVVAAGVGGLGLILGYQVWKKHKGR